MNSQLLLMQLTDSMFPTGAFVHSNGLETYTQRGTIANLETLQAFLTTQLLAAVASTDMIVLKEAMMVGDDLDALCNLDELLSALKSVYETREASIKVGRQFLRSAAVLLTTPLLQGLQGHIRTGKCQGHHALVYGVVYGELGFEPATALSAYAYQFIAGQTSAAMKLISMGQSQAQALIYQMQPVIEQAVEAVLKSSLHDLQTFTPALDIHAMQHQYLFRRLFHS